MEDLLDFWGHLCHRLFSRLDGTFADTIDRLGVQLQRLWVVSCVSKGRLEDVDAFFCRHSKRLRVGDALAPDLDWTPWLSLRYIAVRGAVRWGLVAVANTPGPKSTEDRRSGESVRTRTRRTHVTR